MTVHADRCGRTASGVACARRPRHAGRCVGDAYAPCGCPGLPACVACGKSFVACLVSRGGLHHWAGLDYCSHCLIEELRELLADRLAEPEADHA